MTYQPLPPDREKLVLAIASFFGIVLAAVLAYLLINFPSP